MYTCPKCNEQIEWGPFDWECPRCKLLIRYCKNCDRYSELHIDAKESYPRCDHCLAKLPNSGVVFKSRLYQRYNYAFKFVNRVVVRYPLYFEGSFPFGTIDADLGHLLNDFRFKDHPQKDWRSKTDWGTARAYRVRLQLTETEHTTFVALSHETGLEVFLAVAGGFIGIEVAKFALKRSLETIESAINKWWSSVPFSSRKTWGASSTKSDPLVEKIEVRTRHWVLTIDGTFTSAERERVLDYISQKLIPNETIEEFVLDISENTLAKKIVRQTRVVVSDPTSTR
jgi:hypothetical protein